jgi:ubiquinone/menaquinone biosynthesis C-methylase UbiE
MSEVIKNNYENSWRKSMSGGKGIYSRDNTFGVRMANLVGTGKKVLDIGCGTGKCSLPLVDRKNDVWSVDISASAVEVCQKSGLKASVLDIESDSISDLLIQAPFDTIIMTDILEHLIDPLIVLRDKVLPLLRPGGVGIATIPNFVFYRYRLEILFGHISHFNNNDTINFDPPRPYNLGHKTMFNQANIKETFLLAGFKSVTVEPEVFMESLSPFWQKPLMSLIRKKIKKNILPALLTARFLVIATK